MPTIEVAPIYSDPWTQTVYEGMAQLMLAVPDTPDKTLAGITCRLYCIRFFYTSIDKKRWVEVSAITTWQDSEDLILPVSGAWTQIEPIYARTVWYVEGVPSPGVTKIAYADISPLHLETVIHGFGCTYSILTGSHATCNVTIQLVVHDDADPTNTRTIIKQGVQTDQCDAFVGWYQALDADHEIESGESFALRISMFSMEGNGGDAGVYVKAPFVRVERTI